MILRITDEQPGKGERTFANISELRKFADGVKMHPAGGAMLANATVVAPAEMVEFLLNTLNFRPAAIKAVGRVPAGVRERIMAREDALVS